MQQVLILDGEQYEAHIKVFEVFENPKFPQGYKVSCALVEKETGVLYVLLDNHEPYGYHLQTKLPKDKNFRVSIDVQDYKEAIELFFDEVKKVQNEK
jgi:hypothetical protein